jgi:hypothetical protein
MFPDFCEERFAIVSELAFTNARDGQKLLIGGG